MSDKVIILEDEESGPYMKKFLHLSTQDERWKQASDEELLEAYRQTGERELAAELFNRYVHLAYGLCRRYLKSSEDCCDAVMAVFEQAVVQARETKIEHFNKWLYTTTKNRCISILREEQRNSRWQEEWENFEKNNPEFMENEGFLRLYNKRMDESESSHLVQEAIAQLEKGQRMCVHLFFYEKKSYKDIAEHTGYDINQVKSYLQNGKRRLRLILSQQKKERE